MIIVVGSNGYLGSKIVRLLKRNFPYVIEYEKIVKFNKLLYPTLIIYLKRPSKNIFNFKKILSKFLKQNPKLKFIYVSSLSIYGTGEINNIVNLNTNFRANSDYGLNKLREENYLKKTSLFNTKFQPIIVRCPTIYSNHKENQNRLLNLLLKFNIPLPFKVLSNKRSYLFLENFLDFIVHIIKFNKKFNTFLICEKKNLSTANILEQFKIKNKSNSKLFYINSKIFAFFLSLINKDHLVKKIFGNFQMNPVLSFKNSNWVPKNRKN